VTAEEYRKALGHFTPRGIEEKSVPGPDEDAVTLAVEAGVRALSAGGAAGIGYLVLASEAPVDATAVSEALGLIGARVKTSSGTDAGPALLAALDFCDTSGGRALFVAVGVPAGSPADPGEQGRGAAAAALVCGGGGLIRREAVHYGTEGSRERALGTLGQKTGRPVHIFVDEPEPQTPATLEKAFPKAVRSGLSRHTGDVGPASAFLALAMHAGGIAKGDVVLVSTGTPEGGTAIGFTAAAKVQGGAEVLPDARIPVPYATHLRRALSTAGEATSQGAYVSPTAYRAELKARYRLIGEECTKCGTLHFPPRETCSKCGAREFADHPMRPTGEVYSFTIIGRGAAPSEFAEQQALWGDYATAIVQLDEGPRIAAMLTEFEPRAVGVGTRVRSCFRRIYTQEGVPRYGFKFRPD